jgi:hypothetical protein
LKVLAYSFSRYPVTVLSDYSRPTVAKLRELLAARRYDLLVCGFLQPTLNLRSLDLPRTLLCQHNVESMIPERHCRTSRNLLGLLGAASPDMASVLLDDLQRTGSGALV